MNYGRVENPVWSIFIYGDVQLKYDHMFLRIENWTLEQLVAILLYIQKNLGGFNPRTRGIFENGNAHFFEDIEFDGGNKVRDMDFQEEHDDSVNTEWNLILSCVQADVSRPSSSYSQILYPHEEAPLKEFTVQIIWVYIFKNMRLIWR